MVNSTNNVTNTLSVLIKWDENPYFAKTGKHLAAKGCICIVPALSGWLCLEIFCRYVN
jgi:hypothetical protein